MFENTQARFLYFQLLFQVLFVGMTIGLFRTVVPALASDQFGIPADSLLLLGTFVIVFGLVKATLNVCAGKLSDKVGRRNILIAGWLVALPIPYLLAYAETWSWVLSASLLLGINQGFCWSMSQTMKLDISPPQRYGVTVGLNETFGYGGLAITSYLSAWATAAYGMKPAMLVFGFGTVTLALILAVFFCKETKQSTVATKQQVMAKPSLDSDKQAQRALYFSGMASKFTDTLVWLIFPIFLYQNGMTLTQIGVLSGVYAFTWGGSQTFMGAWSDFIGRKYLIIVGVVLCAISSVLAPLNFSFTWWLVHAFILGLGTAMFYPTMSAAINDFATDHNRGGILGMYRFWRDFGYFVGAIVFGIAVMLSGTQQITFYCNGIVLLLSAGLLLIYLPRAKQV